MDNLKEIVVNSLIRETVESIPEEMFEFFINVPGRNPSKRSLDISTSMNKLDRIEAIDLFRSAVDGAVFSILGLLESGFKENNIRTEFFRADGRAATAADGMTDLYRSKVDPGGVAVA